MKKIQLRVVVALLIGSCLFSSCIGSFSLFNKYEKWQCSMTSNKYVNGIVGLILQPIVGGICFIVDAVVLNTIEFWTGDNPVASNVGKTQNITGKDGLLYAVKTLKNGYEITAPNGEVTLFTYNKKNDSWYIHQNGVTQELFQFNEDGKSIKMNINGASRDFSLNEQGVYEARMAATQGWSLARR